MNAFKVYFEDGNELTTSMNATLDEAKAYYIGQKFNFGDSDERPKDNMVKAIRVEQIFEHAPTPWRHRPNGNPDENGIGLIIEPDTEMPQVIAQLDPTPEMQANAEFIIRAINNHNKLINVCKTSLTIFKFLNQCTSTAIPKIDMRLVSQLQDAIAEAQGKD